MLGDRMHVFAGGESHEFGGRRWNRTTDTGIFKLLGLPVDCL
jgi:hypothetical protein